MSYDAATDTESRAIADRIAAKFSETLPRHARPNVYVVGGTGGVWVEFAVAKGLDLYRFHLLVREGQPLELRCPELRLAKTLDVVSASQDLDAVVRAVIDAYEES